jgi:hypothetical protein
VRPRESVKPPLPPLSSPPPKNPSIPNLYRKNRTIKSHRNFNRFAVVGEVDADSRREERDREETLAGDGDETPTGDGGEVCCCRSVLLSPVAWMFTLPL